jgi:hypothetical protein
MTAQHLNCSIKRVLVSNIQIIDLVHEEEKVISAKEADKMIRKNISRS